MNCFTALPEFIFSVRRGKEQEDPDRYYPNTFHRVFHFSLQVHIHILLTFLDGGVEVPHAASEKKGCFGSLVKK
jgi:hypothetical protein